MTICLRRRLPGASSDRYPRARRAASSPSYLVLLRTRFAWPAGRPAAGRLVPHHFTLTDIGPPETIAASGVISVALSFGSPRLGVAQRPALWSPDFPPTVIHLSAVIRPPRPAVSLPTEIRKHAPCAAGKEVAVGDLEQPVNEVAHDALRASIHVDGQH